MYLVVIAWMYVALMMAVAEATSTQGTLLGALVTFVLYGLLPVALVVYLMLAPARRKMLRAREAAEFAAQQEALHQVSAGQPDAGSHAPADAVAPVRKEP
ncbi:hypothetical protein [Pseudorhodoferax sp. Leaf265]|jgi:hypothetical protein|uniref:hypothetical protein n=1 Tax=Pseudorhodoferax sp. Leaf265 TaxID=1736315 RepID=UPI0006FE711D|nr:hypothetical protein [Pseudorhodoferax sp. Leaf265]KQP03186.1 hypothetical protein ASF45_18380 [Pseudorhodoferax sp. Leaf265]PZP95389.1 MAG: hypothetical protein DI583_22840 [Variovorax paradoxus]PZQ06160.1 MAG: hypothetical protein DI587_22840 [Variovorax paradoxus]